MCLLYDVRLEALVDQDAPAYKIVTVLEKHPQVEEFVAAGRAAMQLQCDLCGGRGHRGNKCATRFQLDAAAKEVGVGWEWGAAKSAGYYRQYLTLEANQLEIKADQAAALDRKINKARRNTLTFKKSQKKF